MDLESEEFMNKSVWPMIENPGMIRKAPRTNLSSENPVQQVQSPSTNHDEGYSLEQEPSHASRSNINQCKSVDIPTGDLKGINKDI